MALATVADVVRLLGQTGTSDPTRDASIQAAIAAAEEWVRLFLRWNPDQTGTQTLKFHDYREDALIPLPPGATVSAVRLYATSDSTPYVAVALTDYEIQRGNRLRLRTGRGWPPAGASGQDEWSGPEPMASDYFERIEVDVTLDDSCSSVPSGVVTGTAIIAGALFQRTAAEMQGITSESIGQYSYSLGGAVTGAAGDSTWIPRSALLLLRPHRKRASVQVP